MILRSLFISAGLTVVSNAAPIKAGQATVDWIAAVSEIEGGKPIQTGIRMKVEDGWHTYWVNPGEAGSKVKVTFTLPDGWTASEISHPAPKRFLTGELPGYGYEAEVIFPVTLTPPSKVEGTAELTANVSWLTCNDNSCVPGKAAVTLTLDSGAGSAEALAKAEELIPKPLAGAKLTVRETGKTLNLSLKLPDASTFDPAGSEVFPVTEEAVDYYKPFRFEKSGPTWSATATKNEYADGPLKELKLVLFQKGKPPVEIAWTGK